MRALRYLGPGIMKMQEQPTPTPQANEVLLKVRACGICGSDVHGSLGLTGRRIPPVTMGHEFSAEVAGLGSAVTSVQVGDGVIVQPIHFCGTCINCRQGLTNMCLNKKFFGVLTVDGAMAEYVAVPEKLLYPLPPTLSYEQGALTEPYAVAYGCVKKAGALKGQNVMIVGAGTIGLCILQVVRLQQPKKIIVCDLSDARLKTAKRLGAHVTLNPGKEEYLQAVSDCTDGEMIDTSFEAVGVEATANQSIRALKIGGTAVWVGMSQKEMQINMQEIVCSARRVIGSFNYTHEEFGEIVGLMSTGKMETSALISQIVPLEDGPEAIQRLIEYPDQYIKIILDPTMKEGEPPRGGTDI